MYVKVVKVPAGEAPLHVRQAWVGTVFQAVGPREYWEEGIVTGKDNPARLGYAVPQELAVEALERRNPAAADWFREHLRYHSNNLIFGADEVVEIHNEGM